MAGVAVITLSLTENDALTVFRAVMLSILPTGTPVILGQVNKVPQVKEDDFVVYWPVRRSRIETNVDESADAFFTGSIDANVLTVTAVQYGMPTVMGPVFGAGVTDGTYITAPILVNPDGTGTYTVSDAQTVTSRSLAGGVQKLTQNTMMTLQVDVHGPNSADNSQIISTLLRDEYGVDLFDPETSGVCPLFADDPKQMPYRNEQQQIENRWMIDAVLQINPIVTIPQQYADVLSVTPVNVEATYPIEEN